LPNRCKLLVIGLDSASLDLLVPWIERKKLPHLGNLLRKGAHGNLFSPLPLSPPAWSSIYTGKNPGKHGIYDFSRRQQSSYSFKPINSTQRAGKDFWEILSDEGLRVGIVNAPIAYPPRKVNGFMITGFMTPGENCEYTYPASLKKELQSVFPDFRVSQSHELLLKFRRELYLKEIHKTVDNIGKVALHLLGKSDCDFFSVFFSETDHVQHWFWDSLDEDRQNGKQGNPILDVYEQVDRIVGQLLEKVDEETWVLVVSDHGGCRLKRFFHPNVFLNSIGALTFQRKPKTLLRLALYRLGITQGLYKFAFSQRLDLLKFLLKPIALSHSDIEWSRTLAFSAGSGQIFINLVGREEKGFVTPKDYDKTRMMLVNKLRTVKDQTNDQHPFDQVYLGEEIFSGPYAQEGPDIQIIAKPTYEIFPWTTIADSVFTPNIERTGTHTAQGLYILGGTGVSPGLKENATVVDIAPTILYILGVPVPSVMDGRVMKQAFSEEFLAKHSIERKVIGESERRETNELSEDEQALVEERLRAMGYLG